MGLNDELAENPLLLLAISIDFEVFTAVIVTVAEPKAVPL
jgi:hypothetical protein